MFALDTIYNIVFLAIACLVTVIFLAGCVGAVGMHKRKLRTWGIVYNVYTAVVWCLLLLLAVTLLLTKLKIFSIESDALLVWGLRVPELGRIVRLLDYQISMILLGAAIILGALSLILNSNRKAYDNFKALEPVPETREIRFDSDEPPQGPIEADGETHAEIGHVAKLAAPADEFAAERIEVEEAGEGKAPDQEERPEADEGNVPDRKPDGNAVMDEAPDPRPDDAPKQPAASVADRAEPSDQEPQPLTAAEGSREPQAEKASYEQQETPAEAARPADEAAAVADTIEAPVYAPKANVYRDLVGKINEVIDDALTKAQPEMVEPEVITLERERSVDEAREIEGEEIPVVSRETFPPVSVRTIVRRPSNAQSILDGAGQAAPPVKKTPAKKAQHPKPAAKKPAAKVSANETSGTAPASEKPAAPAHKEAVASEALITRRHIVMNRRNVVNMFSDYLKNRDGQEKERLEGSINTIIIK